MTNNRPLLTLGKFAIGKYLLDEMLGVKDTIIDNFFNRLENQYNPNPYHNSTHAADVLSSLLYFVHKSSLYENLTDIDILASIVATLGHDNGHPGYTNRFLVNNRDNLAIEYNDVSVLEMMHCSSLFNIMKSLDADIFQNLSNDHYLTVRKLIIEMILATDMGKHFDLLTYFKTKNSACSLKKLENLEQKIDILKISIKSADVGHAAKTRDLHKKWSYLIIEEFFTQGDIEKTRNQPISMYCDRNNTDIPKSQAGFLKNIVLPLYECLSVILASEKIEESCVKEIKSNLAAWEYESNKTRFKTTMMMEEIVITDTTDVKQERTVRRFGTSRPFLDPGKSSWD